MEHPEQFIDFENRVLLEHTSFIDGYIPSTKVMIEQKALGRQSDTVAGTAILFFTDAFLLFLLSFCYNIF